MAENKWGLYSDMDDWKEIEQRLDYSLAVALKKCDSMIAAGEPDAVWSTVKDMLTFMEHPNNAAYGSAEDEPRKYLLDAVNKYINSKYQIGMSTTSVM